MHPHNHRYGSTQALALSLLEKSHSWLTTLWPRSVPGHVQHDWHVTSPCATIDVGPGGTAYLWSSSARRFRRARGLGNHVVIGAPWLYLLDVHRDQIPHELRERPEPGEKPVERFAEPPSGTLLLPRHDLYGRHAARRIADEAREHESERLTAALLPADAASPEVRTAYVEAGIDVVPLVPADLPAASPQVARLMQLRDLMLRHTAVVATHPDEHLLMAAAAGMPTTLIGRQQPRSGAEAALVEAARSEADLAELAGHELGRDHVLPRDELRAVLEWRPRV